MYCTTWLRKRLLVQRRLLQRSKYEKNSYGTGRRLTGAWDFENRVHVRRLRVREKQHVAFVDPLEAADAGAVEPDALGEQIFLEVFNRDCEMPPHAGQIDKHQVYDFYSCVFSQLSWFACRLGPQLSDYKSNKIS